MRYAGASDLPAASAAQDEGTRTGLTRATARTRAARQSAKQSPNVIIDTSRATKPSDARMEREPRRLMPLVKSVRQLLLVTKTGEEFNLSR